MSYGQPVPGGISEDIQIYICIIFGTFPLTKWPTAEDLLYHFLPQLHFGALGALDMKSIGMSVAN